MVTSGSDDWEVGQKWQKLIRKSRTEYPDKSSKMTGMKNDGMFFFASSGQVIGTAAHVPGVQRRTLMSKNTGMKYKVNSSIWKHMNKNTLK